MAVKSTQAGAGGLPSVVCGPVAAAASPMNLLEMQILGHHPRPTKPEILGVGLTQQFVFNQPPGYAGAPLSLRTTELQSDCLQFRHLFFIISSELLNLSKPLNPAPPL